MKNKKTLYIIISILSVLLLGALFTIGYLLGKEKNKEPQEPKIIEVDKEAEKDLIEEDLTEKDYIQLTDEGYYPGHLKLNPKDKSFVLEINFCEGFSDFTGTYSYEDDILILKGNNMTYKMLVIDNKNLKVTKVGDDANCGPFKGDKYTLTN